MINDEILYRVEHAPEVHLAMAPDGGFLGALLNNQNNVLQGQARWHPVDPGDLNGEEPDVLNGDGVGPMDGGSPMNVLFIAAAIAVAVLGTVVVVKTAPRLKRWWLDKAQPGMQNFWDSLLRRGKDDPLIEQLLTTSASETVSALNEIAIAPQNAPDVMNGAEAKRSYIATVLAVAFAAEQIRLLEGTKLEDPEKLQELKLIAVQLSTQHSVDLVNRILESGEPVFDDETRAMFMAVFGGGGQGAGKYIPVKLESVEDAMRFPDDANEREKL